MQHTTAPASDPAAGVASQSAPWRVVAAGPASDFRFHVVFADGTQGTVDMLAFLQSAQVSGTVFEPLRGAAFFAQLRVAHGVVTWPNGADLAPDAMYDAVVERGVWVID
ncbi:MAG: DUF2442 domain-containing protein [Myxococcales bacterium]|nr:DUF2442 domain-containing protein [Myxococcales bacterium]